MCQVVFVSALLVYIGKLLVFAVFVLLYICKRPLGFDVIADPRLSLIGIDVKCIR